MTQSQLDAERCGLIPEDNPPEFFAKHLSAYHALKKDAGGKVVLEVGFGDGYGMNYLSDTASQITGVDIAPNNIPLARAKYGKENLKFLHFDGYRFPFPDRSFDIVCSFQVIEHIPEGRLIEWLSEIKRVLKEEGSFYVSTLNLETAQKPGGAYHKNQDHEKEFNALELEGLLEKVFGRVRMHGLHYSPGHRFFRRLKKWGLLRWNVVSGHFQQVGVKDFIICPDNLRKSIDLFAVCRK